MGWLASAHHPVDVRTGVPRGGPISCSAAKASSFKKRADLIPLTEPEVRRLLLQKRLRREFLQRVRHIDPNRLVFIDESGATTAMTRLRGRAPRGERVHGTTPHGHWKVTTIIGALRRSGVIAPITIDSPTDSDVFREYVEHVLAPVLRPGDVVLMDNLSAHKAACIAERIQAVGAELIYLPPYSPDLNPIEQCWSKVKEFLRSAKARSQRVLERIIGNAIKTITGTDARGFFMHSGYVVH